MKLRNLLLTALVAAPVALSAQDARPAQLTPDQFRSLSWLEGRWVGSGGGFDAFYEQYRMVDEVTLEQTTWADPEFTERDGLSNIVYRDGHVGKRNDDGSFISFVSRMAGDTVYFGRPDGRPGFRWIRDNADQWTAVLERGQGRDPVVYVLKRVR